MLKKQADNSLERGTHVHACTKTPMEAWGVPLWGEPDAVVSRRRETDGATEEKLMDKRWWILGQ